MCLFSFSIEVRIKKVFDKENIIVSSSEKNLNQKNNKNSDVKKTIIVKYCIYVSQNITICCINWPFFQFVLIDYLSDHLSIWSGELMDRWRFFLP